MYFFQASGVAALPAEKMNMVVMMTFFGALLAQSIPDGVVGRGNAVNNAFV